MRGVALEALNLIQNYTANKDALSERQQAIIDLGLDVGFEPEPIRDADVETLREDYDLEDSQLIDLVSAALIARNLASVNQIFQLVEEADKEEAAE
jgi:alkylhydroperoxidase family enzyme